jgi:hypothetical protein
MSLNLKWPGSASFDSASMPTPFGTYDMDTDFQIDAPRTANWAAKRLGYPIVDVELIQDQFFACFEEATSEYSAQVNQFNIRNNLSSLRGVNKGTNYSQKLVDGTNIPTLFRMSQAYGTAVGVGGPVDYKKAYFNLDTSGHRQTYDLVNESLEGSNSSPNFGQPLSSSVKRVVTKVYYEALPAITRFFDPYSVGAQGTLNLISELGFGNYSPAAQFLLMPVYEDVMRIQEIQFNDEVRKSAFSFNIVGNNITIFPIPIPGSHTRIYYDYYEQDDFDNKTTIVKDDVVSDYSDIKYDFIQYTDINDVGRQWIRKYTLALAKELLGAIREKYSSIPIPDAEISLDGAALRAEAQTEKDELIKQLRENLEELSKKNQFEIQKNQADYQQDMLRKIPLKLYKG